MTLIKTSALNAIAVFIKMLSLLGLNKILAVYVGPSGYAIIGQFQNFVQMIASFSNGAVNSGVIKYTAEYRDEKQQHYVWSTASAFSLIGSVFFVILIIIFREELALWLLKDVSYKNVFVFFAVSLFLFSLNSLLLSVINGKKEIVSYVLANIAGSIFSLLVTSALTYYWGLWGALLSLAIYQSLSLVVTLFVCSRLPWFSIKHFTHGIDRAAAVNLSKYSAMALTSAICIPVSHMFIRNHIGESISWDAAGYWEAMWRLSAAYLMFVTTTLSVYYLPRLSELKTYQGLKNEIMQGYRLILPLAIIGGGGIYTARDLIILILFTPEFSAMRDLFAFQMVGDTLKIASWILGYVLVAKAYVRVFILTEIIFSILFVLLVIFFTGLFELKGVAIAHAVHYFFHLLFLVYIVNIKGKLI